MRMILILILAFGPTSWASPFAVNLGGRLVEGDGKPVSGPVTLRAKFFRKATGGTALTTSVSDIADVALAEGVFLLEMALTLTDSATLFDGDKDLWVEFTDVTHSKTYPRQKFSAQPYALRVPVWSCPGFVEPPDKMDLQHQEKFDGISKFRQIA